MNKPMTLDKFFEGFTLDGHYAVWKSGTFPLEDNYVYGFSGTVVEYDNQEGFKDYPKWMDTDDESSINILLLKAAPSLNELMGNDDYNF